MLRPNYAIVLTMGLLTTATAHEANLPKSFVGFLATGTHVGIRGTDTTDNFTIRIYDDMEFSVANDARVLDLEQLSTKYETVAKAREEQLQAFTTSKICW